MTLVDMTDKSLYFLLFLIHQFLTFAYTTNKTLYFCIGRVRSLFLFNQFLCNYAAIDFVMIGEIVCEPVDHKDLPDQCIFSDIPADMVATLEDEDQE